MSNFTLIISSSCLLYKVYFSENINNAYLQFLNNMKIDIEKSNETISMKSNTNSDTTNFLHHRYH